jgi:hypothetical protein
MLLNLVRTRSTERLMREARSLRSEGSVVEWYGVRHYSREICSRRISSLEGAP